MTYYYDPEYDRIVMAEAVALQLKKGISTDGFIPAEIVEEDGERYWKLNTGACLPMTYSVG